MARKEVSPDRWRGRLPDPDDRVAMCDGNVFKVGVDAWSLLNILIAFLIFLGEMNQTLRFAGKALLGG
jgi:hypothetical protein